MTPTTGEGKATCRTGCYGRGVPCAGTVAAELRRAPTTQLANPPVPSPVWLVEWEHMEHLVDRLRATSLSDADPARMLSRA